MKDRVIILVFLAAIGAPLVAGLLGVQNDPLVTYFETRQRPAWSWRPSAMVRYMLDFKRDFNKTHALRSPLIALHARLKLQLFGVSSSREVTLGKDGWLFFAGQEIVPDYQRLRPFTDGELAGWGRLLTARRDFLRARGVPFLFYVVPNPQTLYPEHMPDALWRAANPSRMEQLLDYLQAHTDVDVLDLRPALLAAKARETIVYRTDSHWNQPGAFVAYQEIGAWMKRRFPAWRTFAAEDFERVAIPGWHGALGYLLGAPELFEETRVELRPRQPGRVTSDGEPLPTDEMFDAWFKRPRVVRESEDGEIASALFLRDSQFAAPAQFLSRHFRRSVLLWTDVLDPAEVAAERPSVVVQGVAERLLMGPVPVDPPLR